jgi:cytochrome oxidase assembly protein ShyY1
MFLPALALFSSLAVWQWQRGQAKAAIELQMGLQAATDPLPLDPVAPAPPVDAIAHVRVQGQWDAARSILVDNRSHDERPGYEVWTPLTLSDGQVVLMVNRGWVPSDGRRDQLPSTAFAVAQAGEQQLTGLWRSLPQPALRLGDAPCGAVPQWPWVLQYPTVDELRCAYGPAALDGVLLLDPDQPEGFVREWSIATAVPPERHYAYAAQWAAFALTLIFLFIKLNFRIHP